jgi:hypothetical protein
MHWHWAEHILAILAKFGIPGPSSTDEDDVDVDSTPYVHILEHLFPKPDYDVLPRYTESSFDSSNGTYGSYDVPIVVNHVDLRVTPLLFLVAVEPGNSPAISKCGRTPDEVVKKHFQGFLMDYGTVAIHAICTIGEYTWFYRCYGDTNTVHRIDLPTEYDKTNPENGVDFFSEEGIAKISELSHLIKDALAAGVSSCFNYSGYAPGLIHSTFQEMNSDFASQ